jgi:hypothetical protein
MPVIFNVTLYSSSLRRALHLGDVALDRVRNHDEVNPHRGPGEFGVPRANGINDPAVLGKRRVGPAFLR